MDGRRFDDLTMTVMAGNPTRRGTLRGLIGTALAGVVSLLGREETAACKGAGGKCRRSSQCCSRRCKKRKGKKFGTCRGGRSSGGTGGCPAGQKPCKSGCIPVTNCCADADCEGSTICQDGSCGCPPDHRACPQGVCMPGNGCCAGEQLCDGECVPVSVCCGGCADGEECCTPTPIAYCANLQTDRENCGLCSRICATGQSCVGGDCVF